MAQKNIGYTRVHIDKLSGGLADTGNPSVINNDESPCLFNVDFSQYGSVMSSTMGNEILPGLNIDAYDGVLALSSFTVCDSCDFFTEPEELSGIVSIVRDSATVNGVGTLFISEVAPGDTVVINGIYYTVLHYISDTQLVLTSPVAETDTSSKIYLLKKSPKPSGITIKIAGLGVKNSNSTEMRFYNPSSNEWILFDTIDGKHPFDVVSSNCRIYYSNGYTDLRYACFRKVTLKESGRDPEFPCEVELSEVGYPTCASEYGPTTQATTVIDIVNKFIFFGNGRPGPDLTNLKAWIVNPANQITITVPDPNDPNSATKSFVVGGAYRLEGNILYWTSLVSGDQTGGTFYEKVKLSWAGNELYPTYCGGDGSNRLAEGIRGYMLSVFDNRLFISGDLKNGNLDMVAYSRKAQQFSNETDVAIHLGDFDVVGFKHTISDSDRILFNNSSARITALVVQDGNVYVHRTTDSGTEIYQMVLTSVGSFDGYYKPLLINSSNSASWFRNIVVTNGLQYYITTFYGVAEAKAFGLFPNFITPKSEDRSQKIRRTMENMDFSRGAVAYYNRKIYYAGKYKTESNGFEEPDSCVDTLEDLDPTRNQNDTLLVFDLDTQSYTIYKGFYVSVFLITQNDFFYGSSINGGVYKLLPDLMARNVSEVEVGDEIQSFFSLKRFNFGEPGLPKYLYRVYVEGYLSPETQIELGLIVDCNKTVYNKIKYDEIIKSDDCFGLDCFGVDCEGCTGRYASKHFKKHIEIATGEPIEFITLQPFIRAAKGYWQIDNITFFVKPKADDDLTNLTQCGSINTINDDKCFK